MGQYDYLKSYHRNHLRGYHNWFDNINRKEIEEAETILHSNFPSQLRKFYEEIGYGFLQRPHYLRDDKNYDFFSTNRICPPLVISHFYQGILEHQIEEKEEALEYDDEWLALGALEMMEPGDLPFFEISDSSSFMIMKLHSDNPNAVWFMGAEKIEDSFERFIWRLYYENPKYYAKNW
ncbi:MAG: SMI1/KNR4 family protein [Janthinobacterium lividum]